MGYTTMSAGCCAENTVASALAASMAADAKFAQSEAISAPAYCEK
jgi:hypothetical protein